MLHVLPSTIKKENTESSDGGPGSSSYKRQKDAKNKASSSRYAPLRFLSYTFPVQNFTFCAEKFVS